MTLRLPLCLLPLLIISGSVSAQTDPRIRQVFNEFQAGYLSRDTASSAPFTKELFTHDILIIGTGHNESAEGLTSARRLISSDWTNWLNLRLDTNRLIVHIHQQSADFVIYGIAFLNFPNKQVAYDYAYSRIKQLTDTLGDSKSKVLAFSKEAADFIRDIESGSLEFKYAIRISGSLLLVRDKWQFSQLVYSFPYPMFRE